jgi:biopolymer transport protein TolR
MSMGVQVEERGGKRGRRRGRARPVSEINVTPMVDVMLVLLVIFMITAPLLTVGVPVDLPQTQANAIKDPEEPMSVSINAEGKVFLQDAEIELTALVPRLRAIAGTNPDLRIFVRGDKTVDYGRVMEVMGTINAGGFNKVALITAPPQDAPAKGRAKKK